MPLWRPDLHKREDTSYLDQVREKRGCSCLAGSCACLAMGSACLVTVEAITYICRDSFDGRDVLCFNYRAMPNEYVLVLLDCSAYVLNTCTSQLVLEKMQDRQVESLASVQADPSQDTRDIYTDDVALQSKLRTASS